jgi:hypothetical protein
VAGAESGRERKREAIEQPRSGNKANSFPLFSDPNRKDVLFEIGSAQPPGSRNVDSSQACGGG